MDQLTIWTYDMQDEWFIWNAHTEEHEPIETSEWPVAEDDVEPETWPE